MDVPCLDSAPTMRTVPIRRSASNMDAELESASTHAAEFNVDQMLCAFLKATAHRVSALTVTLVTLVICSMAANPSLVNLILGNARLMPSALKDRFAALTLARALGYVLIPVQLWAVERMRFANWMSTTILCVTARVSLFGTQLLLAVRNPPFLSANLTMIATRWPLVALIF